MITVKEFCDNEIEKREEQQKNCEYCGDSRNGEVSASFEIYFDKSYIGRHVNNIYKTTFIVNYCPMCGRRLSEEKANG